MTDVLIKRGYLDIDIHMGGTCCEDEGRNQSDASTRQRLLKTASKSGEYTREALRRCLLTALGKK